MNWPDARVFRKFLTVAAVISVLPPVGPWLMESMLTHMLVQIPLIFFVAAGMGIPSARNPGVRLAPLECPRCSGLLAATCCLAFWMTPIALDHAATDMLWEVAKIASLLSAGWIAGASWQLASNITKIFYLGNMVWMSITAGMLYQEFKQRLCNAYLWDDQTLTGKALVLVSVAFAITWMLRQLESARG